jgi:hypothetical protein
MSPVIAILTMVAVAALIIAVAALVVAGLSRVDARRSAEAAHKSAETALRSIELMARQIEVAVNEHDRREKKERADSQPHFAWHDGKYGGMYCEAGFQNTGGDAAELSVKTDVSEIGVTINPQDVIPKNGMGKVIFKKRGLAGSVPVPFTIHCKTKLGENWGKSFQLKEWSTITVVEA